MCICFGSLKKKKEPKFIKPLTEMVQTFKKKKGSKLLVYVSVLFYLSELTKLPVSSTQN